MTKEKEGIIKVEVGFDFKDEEISYIRSDFLKEDLGFKDPIGYTAQLLQMALEKWVREKIGIFCPECDFTLEEGWAYCPECGWSSE